MRLKLLILLPLLAATLGACATVTPAHVPLVAKARDNIASTEVVAPIPQHELYVFVPQSNAVATGGGLLGALVVTAVNVGIDQVRTSNAEAAVRPLRDAVVDFNFDETLRGELNNSLSKLAWIHAAPPRVIKDGSPDALERAIASTTSATILLTRADYHLSNNGGTLYVIVNADLYPNTAALTAMKANATKTERRSDAANALYRNSFMYQANAPNAGDDRGRNMVAWSANHGEALRLALATGSAKIARMLAFDLEGLDDDILPQAIDAPPPGDAEAPTAAAAAPAAGGQPQGHAGRQADGTLTYTAK